jgi:hypothetical protein
MCQYTINGNANFLAEYEHSTPQDERASSLIPPNVIDLTTEYSSIPYLLPSRPNPLSFTPPNLFYC